MKDTQRPPAKIVTDLVQYRKSGTVLDIGAGYGRHTFFLAEQGFQVTATDPDEQAYSILEKKKQKFPNVQLTRQSLSELPINETYDIVIAAMVIHFMPNQEAAHAGISKVQSLTNLGGLNCISVFLKKENNNPKPYMFEDGELKKLYEGWNILQYEEELSLPYRPGDGLSEIQSYCARLIAEKK